MPKKPTKWGIKSWVLAESDTGYAWSMSLYTGNNSYTFMSNHFYLIEKERNTVEWQHGLF